MPRSEVEPQLARMVAAIRHEPFYNSGCWSDESAGVYAGWTAIAGSFADGMPLRSRQGRTTLLFSGEDFSPAAGGAGKGQHPAAYLAEMAAADPDFMRQLNGLF